MFVLALGVCLRVILPIIVDYLNEEWTFLSSTQHVLNYYSKDICNLTVKEIQISQLH